VQGGHHLIDVAGGIGVFAIAWLIAGALVRRLGTSAPHAAPLSPQSA
jgi:membrane-associated phospholipid phosphatase